MIITNEKCLDKNNYEFIIMDLIGTKFEIKVVGNEFFPTDDCKDCFSAHLMKLSEQDAIVETVNYFLRNNTISEINNKEYFSNYEWFTTIRSIDNRFLALKIGNNKTSKIICNNIIEKYNFDRYNYCFNNEIDEIDCSNISVKYGYKLVLRLEYDDNCNTYLLADDDLDFLYELIFSKLDYKNDAYIKVVQKNKEQGIMHDLTYLINGDTKIKLNSKLIIDYVNDIIYSYNDKLRKSKEKQFKLNI